MVHICLHHFSVNLPLWIYFGKMYASSTSLITYENYSKTQIEMCKRELKFSRKRNSIANANGKVCKIVRDLLKISKSNCCASLEMCMECEIKCYGTFIFFFHVPLRTINLRIQFIYIFTRSCGVFTIENQYNLQMFFNEFVSVVFFHKNLYNILFFQ